MSLKKNISIEVKECFLWMVDYIRYQLLNKSTRNVYPEWQDLFHFRFILYNLWDKEELGAKLSTYMANILIGGQLLVRD